MVMMCAAACTASDSDVDSTSTSAGADPAPTTMTAEAGTTTAPPTTSGTPTGTIPALRWSPCGEAECATLTVALNHDDPSLGTIDLEVSRLPAQGPGERVGVLLYNPGGPGVPGVPLSSDAFSNDLLARFDVVSWNPRGVSAGTEVDCVDDLDRLLALDPTPETVEEAAENEEQVRTYAAGCLERSGELLPYLSTVSTARDMDLLRDALGEDQVSYLGQSYGTALGSVYATLFPDRVRAMVLDGAFDLSGSYSDWAVQRAESTELALNAALDDCASREFCPFYSDGDPHAAFDELMARLDEEPLLVDGSQVGLATAFWAVNTGLYYEELWPEMIGALADAGNGDGTRLQGLAGFFEIDVESEDAIFCLDWPRQVWEPSQALSDAVVAAAPRLGPLWVEGTTTCRFWPAEPDPPPPLTAAGAGPILVVGTTGDVATPLASSLDLADRLEHGVLLEVERNAHAAYFPKWDGVVDFDTKCVVATVDSYLIDVEVPANQSVCLHGTPQLQPPD